MSSPCTVPRLFRCRVRDFASCFYACRLPLDEESDIRCKPSQTLNESADFNSKRAVRGHRTSRKTSIVDRTCSEDRGESSVQSSSLTNSRGGRLDEPRFAEEDYIVFCFREDGAIHMIGEGKSSEAYDESDEHENTTSTTAAAADLRPINRKLNYSERVGLSRDSRKGGMIGRDDGDTQISQDEIPSLEIKDDEEERSKEMESAWGPESVDGIKEINNPIEQQQSASKMDSFESCDSTLSDTSTSSFAFPVLGIEWTGSPVHMPKTQSQEAPSVCLHCCRF
ncbi:protein BREAKING OF ASYMMETRY IN THE STOMATAL LINEAGE [Sesamum indicum]|uniref:Protein BREAKING OF ASYMMETRY IN THE STOMATAL LINEAGE n=1 Tax=Sesamum indicum TaxID=4182 RepID=A0A6I9TMU2_SESIN|nr:protein BREAKING OF ASYMMETRY IN THE STOMATAL LINEAGE [Sesamum indicum]